MFENLTQQQAKEQILESVQAYYHAFLRQKPPYRRGDYIPYAGRVYDDQELCSLVDSALEFWLTGGRYTKQFEKDLAELSPSKLKFLSPAQKHRIKISSP